MRRETAFHDYTTGAQAERGRQASPIGDSPGSHDGAIASDLDDLRDQHQRADEPAVSTRLATLRDDDVGSAVDRTTCLIEIHHLLHPQAASEVSSIDKLTWIAHVVTAAELPGLLRMLPG